MPIFRFKAQSTYKYFLLWIEWIQISINILQYTHKDIDFAEMWLTTKFLLSTYPHTKYHFVTLLLINLSQYPHTNRYVLLHFCIPQKGLIHKTHPQTLFCILADHPTLYHRPMSLDFRALWISQNTDCCLNYSMREVSVLAVSMNQLYMVPLNCTGT